MRRRRAWLSVWGWWRRLDARAGASPTASRRAPRPRWRAPTAPPQRALRAARHHNRSVCTSARPPPAAACTIHDSRREPRTIVAHAASTRSPAATAALVPPSRRRRRRPARARAHDAANPGAPTVKPSLAPTDSVWPAPPRRTTRRRAPADQSHAIDHAPRQLHAHLGAIHERVGENLPPPIARLDDEVVAQRPARPPGDDQPNEARTSSANSPEPSGVRPGCTSRGVGSRAAPSPSLRARAAPAARPRPTRPRSANRPCRSCARRLRVVAHQRRLHRRRQPARDQPELAVERPTRSARSAGWAASSRRRRRRSSPRCATSRADEAVPGVARPGAAHAGADGGARSARRPHRGGASITVRSVHAPASSAPRQASVARAAPRRRSAPSAAAPQIDAGLGEIAHGR